VITFNELKDAMSGMVNGRRLILGAKSFWLVYSMSSNKNEEVS